MFVRILPLLVAALVTALPSAAHAQLRARLLASGFNRPNGIVFDPVVPGAIYVVDQSGLVRAFLNGTERPTPFLNLVGTVSTGGEQGLLGMAFPPNAAATGRVFVHFTNSSGHSVVARYTRSTADPMVLNAASRFDLQWPIAGTTNRQRFITQDFANHNGGHLAFGPDGYLYIGMGDGGSGDDPNNRAQSPDTLLGKMLRIDVAVPDTDANGYAIPPGQPTFPTMTPALSEIWAFGLRNPWRYNFDDQGSGATNALIVGDVGQGAREEINIEPTGQGGRNYGWRQFEGTLDNNDVPQLGLAYGAHQRPLFEYTHAVGQAITGGYVYRGSRLGAAYQGRYFYADCVQGKVFSLGWSIDGVTGEPVAGTNTEHTTEMGGRFQCISAFARDPNGELYFMDFGYSASNTGRVFVIEAAGASAPGPPTNLAATVSGSMVNISWNAPSSGGAATGYRLEAGTAPGLSNITAFQTTSTGIAVPGVPTGQYFVRVRSTNAVGTSAATSDLTINVGCTPPVAPATFTASAVNRTVSLNWTLVPGSTQTIIEAGDAPGATALTIPIAAPGDSAAFAGVPPGTYYVRTRGVSACGQGTVSVERMLEVQ
jgi:glucose/arabinose dehydrogenase